MYMCAKWTVFVSVPTMLRLDFGTAQGCVFPCFMIQFKKYLHTFAKCYQKG